MVLGDVRKLGKHDGHFAGVVFPNEDKLVGLLVYGFDQEEPFGRTILSMQSARAFLLEAVNGLEGNLTY